LGNVFQGFFPMIDVISSSLGELGLTPFFLQQLHALEAREGVVARVVSERRGEYEVLGEGGLLRASLSGRLEHVLSDEQRPGVGDWVVVEPADPVGRVQHVLERQSVLRRAEVGRSSRGQTLAANVDLCCVVAALTGEEQTVHAQRRALNARRIERYLLTARHARVPALVIVNKADLVPEAVAEARLRELSEELPAVRGLLVSARTGRGVPELAAELGTGTTAVLLGSSGVGKSSLVNVLLGAERMEVGAERSDDTRGRHTTTGRQLVRLASGGLLIDTPGMRELALWADADEEAGAADGFADIEELAHDCRFRDCRHQGEPGCAVAAAVEGGTLAAERLDHAHKLERELLHQRTRVDARLRSAVTQEFKARTRSVRALMKRKGR
jgi:ribosome biogenesis GTPase